MLFLWLSVSGFLHALWNTKKPVIVFVVHEDEEASDLSDGSCAHVGS